MQNYFVPLSDPENTLRTLSAGGVVVDPLTIDGLRGIVFEDENLPHVLQALNMRVGTQMPTSYDGVIKLLLVSNFTENNNAGEEHSVKIGNWRCYSDTHPRDVFKDTIKNILFPTIQKDIIVVLNEDKTRYEPMQDDKFHVYMFSSPTGIVRRNGFNLPEVIWGNRCGIRMYDCFDFSEMGVPIYEDHGYPVAELVGDNLYILVPLYLRSFGGGVEVFGRILAEVVNEITMTPEQKDERNRKLEEQRAELTKKRFVELCVQQHQVRIKDIARLNEEDENDLRKARLVMISKARSIKMRSDELRSLSVDSDQFRKQAQTMYETALSIPKVVNIEFSADNEVTVWTDLLCAIDRRTNILHEIGKFRIMLNFTNGSVRWLNLTRQVKGHGDHTCQAPHVINGDGTACLGDAQVTFAELFAQRDLPSIITLAILFVESANTDDSAGSYINNWPQASTQPKLQKVVQ